MIPPTGIRAHSSTFEAKTPSRISAYRPPGLSRLAGVAALAVVALLGNAAAQPAETVAAQPPIAATPIPTPPTTLPTGNDRRPPIRAMRDQGASPVEQLRAEAAAILPLVECEGVRRWLLATNWLPFPSPRVIYWHAATNRALTKADFTSLSEPEQAGFEPRELDDEFYYYTKYGSPLAYARALDLVCKQLECKDCFRERRILDYGYGGIGHLRLLASNGAHAVGVDVDPMLAAFYDAHLDTGTVKGVGMGEQKAPDGSLALVHGSWPGDEATRAAVGKGFDIIISKNTLKNGYIHPEQEVDKRLLVNLGVSDQTFLAAVSQSLNPGGLFLIYNITPKQATDGFAPWADGRCPFSKDAIKLAGLEVLEYNTDDTVKVRALGRALEWDRSENPMDLETDLFATYTLLRKFPPMSRPGVAPKVLPTPAPAPTP